MAAQGLGHDLITCAMLQIGRRVFSILPGPLWIVLVADADGFVPLTFKPKEELTVRNGKRKSPLRPPLSPETSCPSSPAPGQSPSTAAEAST